MFDTMIIGQICVDTNTDFDGRTEHCYGGAVLYAGHATSAVGNKVAVVTKGNRETVRPEEAFEGAANVTVFDRPSAQSTEMVNIYLTADRERRKSSNVASIDPYTPADLPEEGAKVYHIAGLAVGDIGNDMIEACAKRGDCAVDVQCMLRAREEDDSLKYHDWAEKKQYLPMIRYLKTDAAEAEIMTGLTDRYEAAKLMYEWGAKEVLITHNSEVIVYDGTQFYTCPLKPLNLSGRTGRGDTTFSTYICERQRCGIQESLNFASALVSLKMGTPGPFHGTREDVMEFMKKYY